MRRLAARRPAMLLAAALAAVALAVTACGGDESAEEANAYVAKVNAAQTSFAQTIRRINRQVTAQSTADEDRDTLQEYVRAVDRVVVRLRGIEAPENVAPLHRRLVRDIDAYGREVETATESLEDPTADRLLDAQQRLLDSTSTVTRQINTTIADINRELGATG